ncbi:hypothetical protein [Haladaptatus caseinilyticus]|uniref:hypothetical protein n=1 Tax=Haladaptatus caseinilyticus TaxID=2993314 RepID=UPI00224B23D6|nr:hypothetical protein [Haladaptatus caseinilyticus]
MLDTTRFRALAADAATAVTATTDTRFDADRTSVYFTQTVFEDRRTGYTCFAETPSTAAKANSYSFGPVRGYPTDGPVWVGATGSTNETTVLAVSTTT